MYLTRIYLHQHILQVTLCACKAFSWHYITMLFVNWCRQLDDLYEIAVVQGERKQKINTFPSDSSKLQKPFILNRTLKDGYKYWFHIFNLKWEIKFIVMSWAVLNKISRWIRYIETVLCSLFEVRNWNNLLDERMLFLNFEILWMFSRIVHFLVSRFY